MTAWIYEGDAFLGLERYEEAIAAYQHQLDIEPENVAVLAAKGDALLNARYYHEARAAYEKAIAIEPENARAVTGNGYALRELRLYDDAVAAFDTAMRLSPEADRVSIIVAIAWARNNQAQPNDQSQRHDEG